MIVAPLAILYGLFIFFFAYWDARGTDSDRSAAVREAFNLNSGRAANAPTVECVGNDATEKNLSCINLKPKRRIYCRWWVLERCRSYLAHQYVLTSPETAGKFFDAIINPCKYILDRNSPKNPQRFVRSNLEPDCAKDPMLRRYPIVIVFKGDGPDIRIRID